MKTIPLFTLGLITSTSAFVPLQNAEARHDRHDRRQVVVVQRNDRHKHHNRDRYCAPSSYHHRPSNGLFFSFNISPTPRYVVPVRTYDSPVRNVVADVQVALARRGYNVGPIDGVAGQRTRNALAGFQQDKGLRVTGEINEATLRALGL